MKGVLSIFKSVTREAASSAGLILARFHMGMAIVAFIRPALMELLPMYHSMSIVMPTRDWGILALMTSLGLLMSQPATLLRIISQSSSVFLLTALSYFLLQDTGLTFSVWVYALLAFLSLELLFYSGEDWFKTQLWYGKLQTKVVSHES